MRWWRLLLAGLIGRLRLQRRYTAHCSSSELGQWGEDQAARWLRRHGWRIVGQRVRPNRYDELDIIAAKRQTLAFVEVKTRRDEKFAAPLVAVNATKKKRLNRAARTFLQQSGYPQYIYQFDIIEVIGSPGGEAPVIRHHAQAFPFDRALPLTQRPGD